MISTERAAELVEVAIRNHPEVAWRPDAVERIAQAYATAGPFRAEGAIQFLRRALRNEQMDPDCYPLPFWPETYPPPFPAVPLADWA